MADVAGMDAGGYYSMIIKTGRTLWACGLNDHGQLGDGTRINRVSPVQIMSGVASVSAGDIHSLMIKTDGTFWGCGSNTVAELGVGPSWIINHDPNMDYDRPDPVQIPVRL